MTSSPEGWTLADTQHWLRLALATPHGLAAGLRRAAEQYGRAHPLRSPPSGELSERLAVYARGYFWRLSSCLKQDYPALCALLGDALFERFVESYLTAHPPRHYSLFELGASFPEHLARTRPPLEAVPEAQRALLHLPVDVARLERARLESLRSPSPAPPEPGFELELVFGGRRRIRRAQNVRLVTLETDVRPFLRAVDAGVSALDDTLAALAQPRAAAPATRLAVSAVAHRPLFNELSDWQYRALASAEHALCVVELSAMIASAGDDGAALADLLLWLPSAVALGLIALAAD